MMQATVYDQSYWVNVLVTVFNVLKENHPVILFLWKFVCMHTRLRL